MKTPSDTPVDDARQTPQIEVRAEVQEFTFEHFLSGMTVYDLPIRGYGTKLIDAMKEIYEVSWEFWPATIWVNQIFLTTTPAPGSTPPQTVRTDVSVSGMGFRPGVAVKLKWNNAWGFPGTSVALPSGTPDSHGRFSLVLHHATVQKRGQDWIYEWNNQLVLVAQQYAPSGAIEFYDDYRPVPPHVLWQWIP